MSDLFLHGPDPDPRVIRLWDAGFKPAGTIDCTVAASAETKASEVGAESEITAITATAETTASSLAGISIASAVTASAETGAADLGAETESAAFAASAETGADSIAGVTNPPSAVIVAGVKQRPKIIHRAPSKVTKQPPITIGMTVWASAESRSWAALDHDVSLIEESEDAMLMALMELGMV